VSTRRSKGIALVATLLAISFFSALGLGLALSSATARMVDGNHDDGVAMFNAAESALELAARDLAAAPDWNRALDGSLRSTIVDGPPAGIRTVAPGVVVDLTRLTNDLTCGRETACTEAGMRTSTLERPWGANNPRWQPFLHGALERLTDPRHRDAPYAVVWLGDDARETDANPLIDGGGAGAEGRYVVRARSEVFGAQGARRAIEAELARVCRPAGAGEVCLPGIRVQSWRVVTPSIP
jgi:Tfp pilus assembly protein PilX